MFVRASVKCYNKQQKQVTYVALLNTAVDGISC